MKLRAALFCISLGVITSITSGLAFAQTKAQSLARPTSESALLNNSGAPKEGDVVGTYPENHAKVMKMGEARRIAQIKTSGNQTVPGTEKKRKLRKSEAPSTNEKNGNTDN
jgi:hypothetical protein